MIRMISRIAALAVLSLLLLTSCGKQGSPADPPTDVAVVAGDQGMTVTWTMQPGVEYWLYYAPRPSISTDNWMGPDSHVITNAVSPQFVSGLTNATVYSVTIDGRINHGPAGLGSASVSTTTRLAGATWNAGTPLPTTNLRGVAYGATFAAVGDAGSIFTSSDGTTWTTIAPVTPASNLDAAVFGGAYVAVGQGGTIVYSADAVTWTQQTSPSGSDLYAVATNGAGYYVAAGQGGTILVSASGTSWTAVTPPTVNNLNAVTYGIATTGAGSVAMYVAVDAAGNVWTNTDLTGSSWTPSGSPGGSLTGVTYGAVVNTSTGVTTTMFVAVGTGGIYTSTDGATWTLVTGSPTNMNAVTFGHQFIAVGNGGTIYTSPDGVTWTAATSSNIKNLYAIAHNTTGAFGYSAVGAAGTNLTAY